MVLGGFDHFVQITKVRKQFSTLEDCSGRDCAGKKWDLSELWLSACCMRAQLMGASCRGMSLGPPEQLSAHSGCTVACLAVRGGVFKVMEDVASGAPRSCGNCGAGVVVDICEY